MGVLRSGKRGESMRGFACIALDNPKTPVNIGATLRAAHCYGVSQVVIGGERGHKSYRQGVRHGSNTPSAHRNIPVVIARDPLEYRPFEADVVAVDLVEGATPLPEFRHPQRAVYVFGAEDATLGKRILDRAQHRVMIPTTHCMNLAVTVNVILYDRLLKGGDFDPAYEQSSDEVRAAFYRRRAA